MCKIYCKIVSGYHSCVLQQISVKKSMLLQHFSAAYSYEKHSPSDFNVKGLKIERPLVSSIINCPHTSHQHPPLQTKKDTDMGGNTLLMVFIVSHRELCAISFSSCELILAIDLRKSPPIRSSIMHGNQLCLVVVNQVNSINSALTPLLLW